jgi:hypothetical protein
MKRNHGNKAGTLIRFAKDLRRRNEMERKRWLRKKKKKRSYLLLNLAADYNFGPKRSNMTPIIYVAETEIYVLQEYFIKI